MKLLTINGKYVRTPNGIAKALTFEPQIYATKAESGGDECPNTLSPNDVYFTIPEATAEGQREPQVGDFLVYDCLVANANGNKQILCEITRLDDRGDPYRYGVYMSAICFIPAAVADSGGASESKLALVVGTQDATNNPYEITDSDLDGMTVIGAYALYYCEGLTKIDLSNITNIGNYAFSYCTGLTSVNLPNVTKVGVYFCQYCEKITKLYLPNATSVGSNFGKKCTALTEIDLPNVEIIGDYLGADSKNIISINLPKLKSIPKYGIQYKTNLTTLNIPNVETVGYSGLGGNTGLTSLQLPSVKSLESNAFNGCNKLTSVYMPIVEVLGPAVFANCTALTSLTIPSTCTSIGNNALSGGSTTNKCVYRFEGDTPPAITSTTFDKSKTERIEIKTGNGETYKTATNWTTVADLIVEVDF